MLVEGTGLGCVKMGERVDFRVGFNGEKQGAGAGWGVLPSETFACHE